MEKWGGEKSSIGKLVNCTSVFSLHPRTGRTLCPCKVSFQVGIDFSPDINCQVSSSEEKRVFIMWDDMVTIFLRCMNMY